jgi:hypothetical protein
MVVVSALSALGQKFAFEVDRGDSRFLAVCRPMLEQIVSVSFFVA